MIKPLLFTSLLVTCTALVAPQAEASTQAGQYNLEASPISQISVHLAASDTQRLDSTLATLAQQTHLTFLAEGIPVTPSATETAALVTQQPTTLADVLTRLSNLYDYKLTFLPQSRCVLLQKTFHDHSDLPDVTFEECENSLRTIDNAVDALNPKIDWIRGSHAKPLVIDLVSTLSPEQIQSMQKRTLALASLTEEQRHLAQRTALHLYVEDQTEDLDGVLQHLRDVAGGTLALRPNGTLECDITNAAGQHQSVSLAPTAGTFTPYSNDTLGGTPQAHDDTAGSPVPPRDLQNSVSGSMTLSDAAKWVNEHASPHRHYSVDSALGAKRLFLQGQSYADADALFSGLQQLYGLHQTALIHNGVEDIGLAPPKIRPVASPADIPEMVRNALPNPLLRYLSERTQEMTPQFTLSSQDRPGRQQIGAGSGATPQDRQDRATAFRTARLSRAEGLSLDKEAVRLLRSSFEKRVASGGAAAVPVADLSSEEKSLLALALIKPCLNSMQNVWLSPPPLYISRFSDVYLTGGPYKDAQGHSKIGMFFAVPNAQGTGVQDVGGVTDYDYTPPQ